MAVFWLSELADLEGAMEVSALVLGDSSKGNLALRLGEMGDFERALGIARRIEGARERLEALLGMAKEMVRAGLYERAVSLASDLFEKQAEKFPSARGIEHKLLIGIFEKRAEGFPEVLEALVKRGLRKGRKGLSSPFFRFVAGT